MSTTRLMILGLVRWMQPVHGYDVKRELESWQADQWANIATGSIYHALRKLAGDGLLEEVSTEQVGARPARTTYRCTVKGDLEFQDLLRRYWWGYETPIDPFMAGFAFLASLPPTEAIGALRNRARLVRAVVDAHRFMLASDFMRQTKPAHVGWMFELMIDRLEVEVAWCERVATRIEGGTPLYPEGFLSFDGSVQPAESGWPSAGASGARASGVGVDAAAASDTE
jgi:DNA-binding PadR family transcriptional regulator